MFKLLINASVLLHLVSFQILTSTLLEGNYTCPGQQIIITCATNPSLVVAWSSNQYIGTGGLQLEFTSGDSVGRRIPSSTNPSTFAELTMTAGGLVTESQLHIIVSRNIPTATVTCSDVSGGSTSFISFELLPLLDVPRNISASKVTPPSGDDCITVVNWTPPSNIDINLVKHYTVESPNINSTTLATTVCIIYSCEAESDAQIGVRAVDYCGRDGAASDNLLAELLQASSNSSRSATTEQGPTTEGQQKSSTNTAAIVGGVLGGVIALSIIIALSVALWIMSNRMPVVGRLSKKQLKYALIQKQTDTESRTQSDSSSMPEELARKDKPKEVHQETSTESRVASDSSSKQKEPSLSYKVKPNKELKKPLYVVRLKHIKDISQDISSKSLTQNENPDD